MRSCRTPKSALSPIKLNSTFDLDDDSTLPAYSPATSHTFSAFNKEKIGQKISSIEPLSPAVDSVSTHSQYASSTFSTVSSPYIHISDEYLPSPPAPVVSLPVPAYHRPFSPPTIFPSPPSMARDPDFQVTVETRVEVERIV